MYMCNLLVLYLGVIALSWRVELLDDDSLGLMPPPSSNLVLTSEVSCFMSGGDSHLLNKGLSHGLPDSRILVRIVR